MQKGGRVRRGYRPKIHHLHSISISISRVRCVVRFVKLVSESVRGGDDVRYEEVAVRVKGSDVNGGSAALAWDFVGDCVWKWNGNE